MAQTSVGDGGGAVVQPEGEYTVRNPAGGRSGVTDRQWQCTKIRILSGLLKNMEGQIRKVNLHKRIAEMEFMGSRSVVHLVVEMVEKFG